eukprot:10634405-Ditylum_brightwellii.AAC.1
MPVEVGAVVWVKRPGRGYHQATIVIDINNGEEYVVKWFKTSWGESVASGQHLNGGAGAYNYRKIKEPKPKKYFC